MIVVSTGDSIEGPFLYETNSTVLVIIRIYGPNVQGMHVEHVHGKCRVCRMHPELIEDPHGSHMMADAPT